MIMKYAKRSLAVCLTALMLLSSVPLTGIPGLFAQVGPSVLPGVIAAPVAQAAGGGTLTKEDGTEANVGDPLATGMSFTKNGGAKLTVAVLGDVDCDGAVTSADARYTLRRAVDLEDPRSWLK